MKIYATFLHRDNVSWTLLALIAADKCVIRHGDQNLSKYAYSLMSYVLNVHTYSAHTAFYRVVP